MNYFNMIVLLFLLGFLMVGSSLYQNDQVNGVERDIHNYTETFNLNFPELNTSYNYLEDEQQQVSSLNMKRITVIVNSFVNFLFVSTEQVFKMGIEFGYEHPEINFRLIFKYLTWMIIALLIFYLIKPVTYLIIGFVLLIILIKEKIQDRRKRKIQ